MGKKIHITEFGRIIESSARGILLEAIYQTFPSSSTARKWAVVLNHTRSGLGAMKINVKPDDKWRLILRCSGGRDAGDYWWPVRHGDSDFDLTHNK
ncbi:MAG: hypothetical protein ACKPKO_45100, partial [Candidatus Fonsibacter sp.]